MARASAVLRPRTPSRASLRGAAACSPRRSGATHTGAGGRTCTAYAPPALDALGPLALPAEELVAPAARRTLQSSAAMEPTGANKKSDFTCLEPTFRPR